MTNMSATPGGATAGVLDLRQDPREGEQRPGFFGVLEGFGCEHKTRGSLNVTHVFKGDQT